MAINRLMDKRIVVYLHIGLLLSNKRSKLWIHPRIQMDFNTVMPKEKKIKNTCYMIPGVRKFRKSKVIL